LASTPSTEAAPLIISSASFSTCPYME
jgi:hypothetical protein